MRDLIASLQRLDPTGTLAVRHALRSAGDDAAISRRPTLSNAEHTQ